MGLATKSLLRSRCWALAHFASTGGIWAGAHRYRDQPVEFAKEVLIPNFAMKRDELAAFLRAQPWAVEASVTGGGEPQAAVIGVAVTDKLELIFDTLATSGEAANLRANPRIALVVGWDDGQTAQVEGIADEPVGADLQAAKDVYLRRFPDGHERAALPDITYFRIVPRWIRYSDFRTTPPTVLVFEGDLTRPGVEVVSR